MPERANPGFEAHEVAALPPVLDPAQIARIESVHRGFLYQHLYAVALLLSVGRAQYARIAIERDEDIEFRSEGRVTYFQVKTRSRRLQQADIQDAVDRFMEIREHHRLGKREGECRLIIITNADVSPSLQYPTDIEIWNPSSPVPDGFPAPAATIEEMLSRSSDLAATIPFGSLQPDTLVWKLASLVQHAASGAGGHQFSAERLSELFEQFVVQLHDFPEPPILYRPQQDEPPLVTDERIRLIVGFSGAGKTAWASQSARHSPSKIVYFDAVDVPTAAVATSIAREVAARFLGGNARNIGGALSSGGLELLRACSMRLREQGDVLAVVLDNIHKLDVQTVRQLIEAAPALRWVLLAQPWAEKAQLEAVLPVRSEELRGWGADEIAGEFAAAGAPMEHLSALAVRRLTGGLPLFVRSAASLTMLEFEGSAERFCDAVVERTHGTDTAQDVILASAFNSLPGSVQDVVALLAQIDVPLETLEIDAFLNFLGSRANIASAIRALKATNFVISFPGGRLGLHDAMRSLGHGRFLGLDPSLAQTALHALHKALLPAVVSSFDVARTNFFLRLLPRIGRTDVLVDLATNEMFHEQGDVSSLRQALENAAANAAASPLDRFWANDALAFWESRDGGTPSTARLTEMSALVAEGGLGSREQLNLIFKELLLAAAVGDRGLLEKAAAAGRRLVSAGSAEARLLRYNRAIALYRMGALQAARSSLEQVVEEYFQHFGVREPQLIMAKPADLVALFPDREKYSDLKRLADSLSAWSGIVTTQGHPAALRRLHAAKLFALTGAGRSAASAAQDAADEMLAQFGDAEGARELMEAHALPLIRQYELVDLMLPARSQYAVILAWCGEFEQAKRELDACRIFARDRQRETELANQARLIAEIENGRRSLMRRRPPPGGWAIVRNPNLIGRLTRPDDLCACGSGRKYKRCHGR